MHASSLRSIAVGTVAVAAIVGFSVFAALTHKVSAATTIVSGDLIRGQSFSAVYYMGADGFRYVFPNEKTYFTWYSSFDSVKFISDADLGNIQIGGNVTYKPNTRMIKINTDPKVYAVSDNGVLHWVSTAEAATILGGSDWSHAIDDVPDGFFTNYSTTGTTLSTANAASTFKTSSYATNVNLDKDLAVPKEISITSSAFSPLDINMSANRTVRFTNNDTERHTATGDDGVWGTGTILPGGNFIIRFTTAGTYTFYDGYDSALSGAIYVE
jgi:plastocyanin